MHECADFNGLTPLELEIMKLYEMYSIFHESVEDFIGRMEFDNGRDWLEKFTTAEN